jgi:hypothetical protein
MVPRIGGFGLLKVPDGFEVRTRGATIGTTRFECVRCGVLTERSGTRTDSDWVGDRQ